jgi:hypothetical protein
MTFTPKNLGKLSFDTDYSLFVTVLGLSNGFYGLVTVVEDDLWGGWCFGWLLWEQKHWITAKNFRETVFCEEIYPFSYCFWDVKWILWSDNCLGWLFMGWLVLWMVILGAETLDNCKEL